MDEIANINEADSLLNRTAEKNTEGKRASSNVSAISLADNDAEERTKLSESDAVENWGYEAAITATGYGRYNYMLQLVSMSTIFASLFCCSSISFILPSAECDLNLKKFDKGMLNAVPYFGMIATGVFWGFFADTFGRQKVLVLTLALDAIFNIAAALVQSYSALLTAKLLDGLVCSAPYSIFLTYLSECNPDNKRAFIIQLTGVFMEASTIILPLIAWAILPLDIPSLLPGAFEMPSWRWFLLLSTIPGIISAITFTFRWESPKFLLSQGRDEEALECLRQMYVINTKQPADTFPVRSLRVDKVAKTSGNTSILRSLVEGLKQVLPLFRAPHVKNAFLIFTFQFGALFGLNTMRLWMPQLFSYVLDAERDGITNTTSVCDLVAFSSKNESSTDEASICLSRPVVEDKVYINSILLGIIVGVIFLLCGYLTKRIGDNILIVISTLVSVASCIAMYWGTSSNLMLIFGSTFVAATSVSTTTIFSIAIRLFPTEMRSVAVALTLMIGQAGGLIGNLIFPILLDLSCIVPFFALAALLLVTGSLILLIPAEKGRDCDYTTRQGLR